MTSFFTSLPLHPDDVFSLFVCREMQLAYTTLVCWRGNGHHYSSEQQLHMRFSIQGSLTVDNDTQHTFPNSLHMSAAREQVFEFLLRRNMHLQQAHDGHLSTFREAAQLKCIDYMALIQFVLASDWTGLPRFPRVVEYYGVQFTIDIGMGTPEIDPQNTQPE